MSGVQEDGRTFLSLESKVAQPTVRERLESLRRGEHPAPIVVELDMTSFCDFECPECISASVLGTSRFSRERLVELCEQMASAGVRAVILTGGGEPLRHHAATRVIETLSARGIDVGLITNGYNLGSVPADLIRSMSWIRVSLDAGRPSTYVLFRPHPQRERAFATVLSGIEHAIKSGCPRVGISYVLLTRDSGETDNFSEVLDAARLGRDLGAHYLNVKAMQNSDHTVFRYSPAQIARIYDGLGEARRYETDGFRLLVSANLEAVLHQVWDQDKTYERCLSVALRALVTPEGMFPCAYHRGNPSMRYPTDPARDGFEKMWKNAATVQVDPRVDCRFHCARHESNRELERELSDSSVEGGEFAQDWDLFI